MKFLGIGDVGHDSSISLYDNGIVRYHKFEREFGEKHMSVSAIEVLMERAEQVFGIPVSEYDAIGANLHETGLHNLKIFNPNSYVVDHHLSHALSGWMVNPNPDLQITIDGIGDSVSWAVWKDGQCLERHLAEDGSIGLEIDKCSRENGIDAQWDVDLAGKFMGLQSYGEVHQGYLEYLRQNTDIFGYFYNAHSKEHWDDFHKKSALWVNKPLDFFATLHHRFGEMVMQIFDKYATPEDSIIYSGGVAQNVLWNTELKKKYPKLQPLPHSGDEGLSLGIIEWMRIKYNQPIGHIENFPYAQNDESVESPSEEIIEKTAQALADGKVVAWYQGNGEIGPRALGNRSLLMNPTIENGREVINNAKNREQYRPFGASVLQDKADEFFDDWIEDKYMLYTAKPKQGYPAITHVDGTCRVQTVGDENPLFKKLMERFYQLSGCAVLLNTSLNLGGKPTCSKVSTAFAIYAQTEIDILVVGNKFYEKLL